MQKLERIHIFSDFAKEVKYYVDGSLGFLTWPYWLVIVLVTVLGGFGAGRLTYHLSSEFGDSQVEASFWVGAVFGGLFCLIFAQLAARGIFDAVYLKTKTIYEIPANTAVIPIYDDESGMSLFKFFPATVSLEQAEVDLICNGTVGCVLANYTEQLVPFNVELSPGPDYKNRNCAFCAHFAMNIMGAPEDAIRILRLNANLDLNSLRDYVFRAVVRFVEFDSYQTFRNRVEVESKRQEMENALTSFLRQFGSDGLHLAGKVTITLPTSKLH